MSIELTRLFTEKTRLLELREKILEIYSSLNLDFYIDKLSKIIGVPRRSLYQYIGNWYYENSNAYFFKDLSSFEIINELLGEAISKYFDLETVNYSLAKVNHLKCEPSYGLASLNFCSPKFSYKTTHDLGIPLYALSPFLSNLDIFNKYFKDEKLKKEFILSLKRLFVRDFLAGENDRKGDNLLFQVSTTSLKLAPLFDYEWSFSYKSDYYVYDNSLAIMDLTDKDTLEYLQKDIEFQEIFTKLLDINILKLLKEIGEVHEIIIPNDIKDIYVEQVERVKELVVNTLIK